MSATAPVTEHLDVLIVGAGISGVGAAYYLQRDHPQRSFALLEARGAIGGTWDLFRYPGIRSDSDMQTFGYAFRPWTGNKAMANGDEILDYLQSTIDEYGIKPHIRFHHRVVAANWSSTDACWRVDVRRTDTDETIRITCNWLVSAAGYYRYDRGHTPHFDGRDDFEGVIVHPQHWPADLDCTGKKVVVIGSGATAVTLVPALAPDAAHVTMLQRSPTYIMPLPAEDKLANWLRERFGDERGHALARRKNIAVSQAIYRFCQRFPDAARRLIRSLNVKYLPDDFDVDTHLNPAYGPWDQRLCAVPDGDLFHAISSGKASIVTDQVERFTPTGIRLVSGESLDADVIVTATGFDLQLFGDVSLQVDDEPVAASDTVAFRGMMLSDIPNFAFSVGYTNASWTLKVDLVFEHLSRILAHMDRRGFNVCTPRLPEQDLELHPLLDFKAGYVQRSLHELPRRADVREWQLAMDYKSDAKMLLDGPVATDDLEFRRVARSASRT